MQPTAALGMSLQPFQTTWGMEWHSPPRQKSIFELVIIQEISGDSSWPVINRAVRIFTPIRSDLIRVYRVNRVIVTRQVFKII